MHFFIHVRFVKIFSFQSLEFRVFDRSEVNVWRERRTLLQNFSEAARHLGNDRLLKMLHTEFPLEIVDCLSVLEGAKCCTLGELVQSTSDSALAELFHFQLSFETGLFEIVIE